MTIAEILLQDFDHEMQGTRTTLERVPETNPDFKCHEKSTPMGYLAAHVSTLPRFGITILTTDVLVAEEIEPVTVARMIDCPGFAGSLLILAEHENHYIRLLANLNRFLNAFRI